MCAPLVSRAVSVKNRDAVLRLTALGLTFAALAGFATNSVALMTLSLFLVVLSIFVFVLRAPILNLLSQRGRSGEEDHGSKRSLRDLLRRFWNRGPYLIDVVASRIQLTVTLPEVVKSEIQGRWPSDEQIIESCYDKGYSANDASLLLVCHIVGSHVSALSEADKTELRGEILSLLRSQQRVDDYRRFASHLARFLCFAQMCALDWLRKGEATQPVLETAFEFVYEGVGIVVADHIPFPLVPATYRESERDELRAALSNSHQSKRSASDISLAPTSNNAHEG